MSGVPHHTILFEKDEDDWWLVECACGWKLTMSVPDADIAADEYGDHREEVARR